MKRMFERVGRMFWPNKADEEGGTSNKKTKLMNEGNCDDPEKMYTMQVDDSKRLLDRIKQLYQEQLMSDITLVVSGKEYASHRFILCATSDVFQVMLMNSNWNECHETRVELVEQEPCAAVFHIFLEYFYSGQITLNHENVMPILALSDKYNIKSLIEMCLMYMCNNIAHAASNNQLISWLQYTLACGHSEVAEQCQNYVKWNLESISETEDYINFDSDVFVLLLQQNDLVVTNEITLYNCAVKWLDLQSTRLKQEGLTDTDISEQMETLTEHIMLNIRFPMMSPRQLAELLLSPLIKKYKEFFVERMGIGMLYHSGQEERIQDMCTNERGKLLFTPRLYTGDNCSTVIEINNFSSMLSYASRNFVFSSHTTLAEYKGDSACEWMIDLYPKGVWFKKFYLIVWQGTVEVPEYIIPTVRLAITCKDNSDDMNIRAKIAILVYGTRTGIEHVVLVKEKVYTFNTSEKLLNIDDIVPFNELNPKATDDRTKKSTFLIGENRDTLKMHIIITPLSDICSDFSEPIFT